MRTQGLVSHPIANRGRRRQTHKNILIDQMNQAISAANRQVAKKNTGIKLHKRRTRVKPALNARSGLIQDKNQYRQLTTYSSSNKKRVSASQRMNQLVKASLASSKYLLRMYGFDNTSGGTDTGGRINPCGLEKPGASTIIYYPLYVFDLTAQPQAVKGTLRNPVVGYRLFSDTSSVGNVQWYSAINSLNNAGGTVSGAYFQPYVTPGNTATGAGQIFPKLILDYLNIKYTLRGPRNRPTKYVVEIVQPYKWFGGMPDGNAYAGNDQGIWQQEANRLCANLCQSIPAVSKKPWKVIWSRTYDIQPTSSSETDVGGHDIHHKHFWRCNRLLSYDKEFGVADKPDPDSDYTNLNIGTQEFGRQIDVIPETGHSLYLIIKAYSPVSSGGFDATVHPSFDLSIEKKVSTLNPMTALT